MKNGSRDHCTLTPRKLMAYLLAPTWSEVANSDRTLTPSPMALGRGDKDLHFFMAGQDQIGAPYHRAFWHPGIGLWQLDDGGFAMGLGVERFHAVNAADSAAKMIADLYCNCTDPDSAQCAAIIFGPSTWVSCGSDGSICWQTFQAIYNPNGPPLIADDYSTDSLGGSEYHVCTIAGAPERFHCLYVDTTRVEGYSHWTTFPDPGGLWPLAQPFYVYNYPPLGAATSEIRYWMAVDGPIETGPFPTDISAMRTLGINSRDGLIWKLPSAPNGDGLCDLTRPHGDACLGQYRSNGTTPIVVGSETDESAVKFRALMSDPNGQSSRLEIELRQLKENSGAFSDSPTQTSPMVTAGNVAEATANGLIKGYYHWQARTVNATGQKSPWQSFGGNPDGVTDFTVGHGGTLQVRATVDGSPYSGFVSYSVSGPTSFVGTSADIYRNLPEGNYTVLYLSGGPANTNYHNITPGPSQYVSAGSPISWTLALTTDQGQFCSANSGADAQSALYTTCGGRLSVILAGTGSGRILSSPVGIDCPGSCSTSFPTASQVTLSPSPSPGSTFSGWTGDSDCFDGVVTINGDRTCTATFTATATAYPLSIATSGSGTVSSIDGGINCGATCTHTYVSDTPVTLTASAASGWSFSSWSGNCSGGPSIQVTMTSSRNCTATFVQTAGTTPETTTGMAPNPGATSATLNGTVNPHGLATTAFFEYGPDPFLGYATPGVGFGNGNSPLSFSQPVTGLACATTYRFRTVGVSAAGEYRSSNNTFQTAACPPAPCNVLTLTQNGDGAVPVATPAQSSGCPFSQYHAGEHITLTASAGDGNIVTGWGGTDNNASTATVNTMTMPASNWTAFASYGHICYHLSLGYTGQGAAPVATNPVASCPADYFPWGYEVRVESSPATGWRIGGWSGTSNDATMSPFNFIVMPIGNTTALVQYIPLQYLVQISKGGNGEGTVASDLPGINCGPTCTASYPYGTTVTFTATAATGSSFGGWSDQCAGGVVTIDGVGTSKNCTATFVTDPLQEWAVERAGGKTLLGVYFLDENEGWAVGGGGTILHTTNGGTTWEQQISPSPYYQYNAVYFADHGMGWAAGLGGGDGNGGVIVHTTDGGATWSVQYDGGSSTSSRIWWLAGVDQNRLWAAASSGLLWSTDGGMNWQLRPMSPLWRVRFADVSKGWATTQSGEILKSGDGGATWETAYTPPNGGVVIDLGLAGSKVWGVGSLSNLKIVDTLDGVQWQEQSSGTTDILRSSSFLDACTGWAVGGGGTILKTLDGGTNWTGSILSSSLYDVFFTRRGGWAVGQGGVILKYMKPISPGPSLAFRNNQFGSSGGDGTIDVTTPAGCGWGVVSENPDFITITSGTTGVGNARVTYHVAPNSGLPRHGTIDVAGVKFSIEQAGASCNAVLSPMTQSFGITGGTGTFSISTQSGCSWTAATDAQWIVVTQSSGTGSGTMSFTLQGNPDSRPRSATIGVNGSVFTVYQAGPAVAGEALKFFTITPCRVYDTRPVSQLVSGAKRYVQVTGICGVPSTAKAISANVSITGPTGGGYLTIWPSDLGTPGTSIINFSGGQTRTNNAILPLATDGVGDLAGLASVLNSGNVHLILDVNGYFQ